MSTPPPLPPPAYSVGLEPGSDTSQPRRLTVEVDEGELWAVCSCGWTQCFVSGVAWGEFGYHVSLHADTHRKNPRNFLADLDEPQYDRVERPDKPRWWQR